MTKFNSITRKIKKKNKERRQYYISTFFIIYHSRTICVSWIWYTSLFNSWTISISSIKYTRFRTSKMKKDNTTEKNKKKKSKYKLKKRQLKKNNPHNNKSTQKNKYFLTTTWRWLWKTQKSVNFTIKQKKSLFKAHHISKIIKKNNSMLYNLKSTISNTSFKNNSGNISFSQQSSTQQTPATILEEIIPWEWKQQPKNIILNIKATEKNWTPTPYKATQKNHS